MVIEWKSILFVMLMLFAMLVIIKLVGNITKMKGELKRKAFHVSMGIVMLTFPYIFNSIYSVGMLGIIALVTLIALKSRLLKNSLGTVIYDVDRKSMGEIFFVISVFLIFYLAKGDKILYSIPILILSFADSSAALVGKSYAKENLAQFNEDSKSIEGSFAFFVVAFMATHVPLLLYTTVGRAETLAISAIVGFNVALIEMISHTGNDNLLIPLTTFALLSTHINLSIEELKAKLLVLVAIFALITIVNRIKSWTKLALVELLVAGYLMIVLYGIYAVIPPLLFLLTCMTFPNKNENEKENIYDSRIIETNIIIGIAICGIVAITGYKKQLFMLYVTCFAMHLAVNTFVRMKYYFNFSELKSIIFSYLKGLLVVFLPGLIIQKLVFKELYEYKLLFLMLALLLASCVMICMEKRNVQKEEISIQNGYIHLKIVSILMGIIGIAEYLVMGV